MLHFDIERGHIPESVKMYFDLDNPSFFAKSNHYIGYEQMAMIVYCLLGRSNDFSPSALLKRPYSPVIQIQPCRSTELAEESLDTLFLEGNSTQLSLANYVWFSLSGILLGAYDDHQANSSVINLKEPPYRGLARFDHKCIGTHPDSFHASTDALGKVQYYLPYRTFLLQSHQRDSDIPQALLNEILDALKDLKQFFDIFPSTAPFFNRIKEHVICASDRITKSIKGHSGTVSVLELVKSAYPSSKDLIELILKVHDPESKNTLYNDFFSLTNTPIPILVGYFKAHQFSSHSITKALTPLLVPKGILPKLGKTIHNLIQYALQKFPKVTHDDVRTNTPLFQNGVQSIHKLILDSLAVISSTPKGHRREHLVSTDDPNYFAENPAVIDLSPTERQSSFGLFFSDRPSLSSWSSSSEPDGVPDNDDDIVFS